MRVARASLASLALGSVCLLTCHPAHAAGGHFEVDDALVLDAGRCQIESWATQALQAHAATLHVGPACRVGPTELGLNVDRVVGRGTATLVGAQVKWTRTLGAVSAGAVAIGAADTQSGRVATTVYAPVSWHAAGPLWLHVNAGFDRLGGATRRRVGAAVEWAPVTPLTLIAERIEVLHHPDSRLGARWAWRPSLSVDVGAAHLGGSRSQALTLGLNSEFAR